MNFQGCVDLSQDQCELFSKSVGVCETIEPYYVCDSTTREQFKSLYNNDIKILEIGPYNRPYYRGENVKYFDAMNQDEIRFQMINENDPGIKNHVIASDAELAKVPFIDYVNQNGDMSIIDDKFDLIFSSHNLEHQIDLVSHLQQVEKLLKNDGQVVMLVPDKRFCFDHFVPESPLSDILESYYNKDKIHPLRTILAMVCETTHNKANEHLAGNNGEIKGKDVSCYKEALERYSNSQSNYINAHRWRFTPTQFSFVINSLNKLELINLKIKKLRLTKKNQLEFSVVLEKNSDCEGNYAYFS